MNGSPSAKKSSLGAYLLLAAIQIFGAAFLVWTGLPFFKALSTNPGAQLPTGVYEDLIAYAVLIIMQSAYWYRFFRVPIPALKTNAFLNHLLIFMSRISFIFGGAFFSVVSFRHVPELTGADVSLLARHGVLFVTALFSLFCISLELERLGQALEPKRPG